MRLRGSPLHGESRFFCLKRGDGREINGICYCMGQAIIYNLRAAAVCGRCPAQTPPPGARNPRFFFRIFSGPSAQARFWKGHAVPLQKFRDKQKLIYWVVAIIVIPSFILLGFIEYLRGGPGKEVIGRMGNTKYTWQEFMDFRARLRAVNGGRPIFFTISGYQPAFNEQLGEFFAMIFRDEAANYGIDVSDEEIGTFIRMQFGYAGGDGAELQRMVERAVGSTIRLNSVYEYKMAVREWLCIKKFLEALDNTVLIPQTLAELSYGQEHTTYRYRKLFIPADQYLEEAKKELGALDKEDILARAKSFVDTHQTDTQRDAYPFLWGAPKWRFDYIIVPLVVPELEPQADDAKLRAHYEANKARFAAEDGSERAYELVASEVAEDYRKSVREGNARATIGDEFDRFLTRQIKSAGGTDPNFEITLEMIGADSRLSGRGLRAGVSGEQALTQEELLKNPLLENSGIAYFLAGLDYRLRNMTPEKAAEELKTFTRSFRGMRMGNREQPISGRDSLMRVRVLEYVPGGKLALVDADGNVNQPLLDAVKEQLAGQLALSKARLKTAEASLVIDGEEFEGNKIAEEVSDYFGLSGNALKLRAAAVGQIIEPHQTMRPQGYEIIKLVGREFPEIAQADTAKQIKALRYQWQGNSAYTPELFLSPVIKLGQRQISFINSALQSGRISYENVLSEEW